MKITQKEKRMILASREPKHKSPEAEIKWLRKALKKEKELGHATLKHAEQAEDVAVQDFVNKLTYNIKGIMKEFDDFKKIEITPARGKMILNIISKLKNGLKASGINI